MNDIKKLFKISQCLKNIFDKIVKLYLVKVKQIPIYILKASTPFDNHEKVELLANSNEIDYTSNEMPEELMNVFRPIGIVGEKPQELKRL